MDPELVFHDGPEGKDGSTAWNEWWESLFPPPKWALPLVPRTGGLFPFTWISITNTGSSHGANGYGAIDGKERKANEDYLRHLDRYQKFHDGPVASLFPAIIGPFLPQIPQFAPRKATGPRNGPGICSRSSGSWQKPKGPPWDSCPWPGCCAKSPISSPFPVPEIGTKAGKSQGAAQVQLTQEEISRIDQALDGMDLEVFGGHAVKSEK